MGGDVAGQLRLGHGRQVAVYGRLVGLGGALVYTCGSVASYNWANPLRSLV